jgi:GNAT superfamily N-acetyltransferase
LSGAPEEGVRRAGAEDVAVIVDLARLMRAELAPMKGGTVWLAREARPEPLEAGYAALVEDPAARVVVGTVDGTVIGFGVGLLELLQDGSTLGVIAEIFVHEEARAIGVGEAMLGDLMGFFTTRGCAGIDSFALPGHRTTKNFFEENGFTARALLMHHRIG